MLMVESKELLYC